MFAITGATRLHYVSGYTDMRSGRFTLANIIRSNLGGDPYNGNGYVFMSKDRRKMKTLVYRNHLYMLYDLSFGDYIEDICTRIMHGDEDYESMLPCDYKPTKVDDETQAVA